MLLKMILVCSLVCINFTFLENGKVKLPHIKVAKNGKKCVSTPPSKKSASSDLIRSDPMWIPYSKYRCFGKVQQPQFRSLWAPFWVPLGLILATFGYKEANFGLQNGGSKKSRKKQEKVEKRAKVLKTLKKTLVSTCFDFLSKNSKSRFLVIFGIMIIIHSSSSSS